MQRWFEHDVEEAFAEVSSHPGCKAYNEDVEIEEGSNRLIWEGRALPATRLTLVLLPSLSPHSEEWSIDQETRVSYVNSSGFKTIRSLVAAGCDLAFSLNGDHIQTCGRP